MTLQTDIDERLWAAIEPSYSVGNYSAAILESIHFLSDLIRTKSGLESDGNQLVGDSFGGPDPVIKLNSLQTESERNEQKGVEFMLRGLYSGVRNPRSHEKRVDTLQTANAIIGLAGYLVGVIDKGRSPYDVQELLARVFDKHFPPTLKYAELLVEEIPSRKRLDTLMQVLQRREEGESVCISLFCKAAVKTLSPEGQAAFWAAVSEALRTAATDAEFKSAIQIAGDDWLRCSELSRLRAENRLIKSIQEGRLDRSTGRSKQGGLGTWAAGIAEHFQSKGQLISAINSKLTSDDPEGRAYAFKFFFPTLRSLQPKPPAYVVETLARLLSEQDEDAYAALGFVEYPEFAEPAWAEALLEPYKNFIPRPPQITDDDVPF